MTNRRRPLRRTAALLTLLAASAVLTACGSSSSSTTTAAAAGGGAAARGPRAGTALVACLKRHGVTLPSQAGGTGAGAGAPGAGGPPGGGGPGAPGGNAKLQAALRACGATSPGPRSNTAFRAALTKYVACVRAHGYQLPTPNFSGRGSLFNAKIQSDPKFKAASKPCQSQLATPQPGAAPGAPGA
jgi:hypothetical protein